MITVYVHGIGPVRGPAEIVLGMVAAQWADAPVDEGPDEMGVWWIGSRVEPIDAQ